MKPIYKPQGRAADYGELAINIYSGCNHGCSYCYAPAVLRKTRKDFGRLQPRKDIVLEVSRQLEKGMDIEGKTVHLCFTCDPYPAKIDTTPTREIIRLIHRYGGYVQILTKAGKRALCDFDLLGDGDWFGVSLTWADEKEPLAENTMFRIESLRTAHKMGIRTWVSLEPVFNPAAVFNAIKKFDFIDLFKIGKLNYLSSDINWREFGEKAERLCLKHGRNYEIKGDLRALM
jgi:DNA repair photolyase